MKKFLILLLIAAAAFAFVKVRSVGGTICKDCNVILITLTNLRYDHMTENGYFRPTTPNLDTLASKSLVFDNMFSHSSWTLPEGISIYTSLYPYQHGVMNRFDGSVLSKNTPSLIDILAKAGYKTAAFTGGFDYDPRYGLMDRFGEYDGCGEGEGISITTLGYGKVGCTIPKALAWLKNNFRSKFFIHLQGFDVHCPFSQTGSPTYDKNYKGNVDFSNCLWTFEKTNPVIKNGQKFYPVYSSGGPVGAPILLSEADVKHLLAIYDEAITDSDRQLGDFLNQIQNMGLDKNTIIIFTSEHGDMFGKYGIFMRGGPLRGTFYDDVLHTPFIMKVPGVTPARLSELTQQVDIMPTILDFLGLAKPGGISGKSLFPAIFQGKEINQYVFAGMEYHPGIDNIYFNETTDIEAIRSKDWKLIKETDESAMPPKSNIELFDLRADPGELKNLEGSGNPMLKTLETELDNWAKSVRINK